MRRPYSFPRTVTLSLVGARERKGTGSGAMSWRMCFTENSARICGRITASLEGALMDELIFVVEEAPEGGLTARALGESIFTEADTLSELHAKVRDAVRCHFDEGKAPKVVRLHHVREEVIAV